MLYVLIGALAVAVAFGKGGSQVDRQGALHRIAVEPSGRVLLRALAVGFGCMALWWAWLAVHGEPGRRSVGDRLVDAAPAVFYAFVCWGTAAFPAGSSGGSNVDADVAKNLPDFREELGPPLSTTHPSPRAVPRLWHGTARTHNHPTTALTGSASACSGSLSRRSSRPSV